MAEKVKSVYKILQKYQTEDAALIKKQPPDFLMNLVLVFTYSDEHQDYQNQSDSDFYVLLLTIENTELMLLGSREQA